jgi:hypothetical protein
MFDFDTPFLHFDKRCFVVVVHFDDKGGSPHGDNRGWRDHAIRIRLPPQVLDVHANTSNQHIQQISPIAESLAKLDSRIGVNLKRAAVGELEKAASVGSSNDHLLHLD